MSKRQSEMIEVALKILRETRDTPGRAQRPSPAIRLALLTLLPHCPERWPLTQLWEGINGTHEIGRGQTVTAAYNGILRQLKASGSRPLGQGWD